MNVFDIYEDLASFSKDVLIHGAVGVFHNANKDKLAAMASKLPASALNAMHYTVASNVAALIRTGGAPEAERMAALQTVQKWAKARGVDDFKI